MVVRKFVVVAACSALLAGCGGGEQGAGSAVLPTPHVSDGDQIRKVLYSVADAGWDAAKTAELTCEKFRAERGAKPPNSDLIPPMDTFSAADSSPAPHQSRCGRRPMRSCATTKRHTRRP
jgi:hypothetical protein